MAYREWIGNIKRAYVHFQIQSDGYNIEVQKTFSRLNFKNTNKGKTDQTCSVTEQFLNSNAINYGRFLILSSSCCNYLQPLIFNSAPISQDDWELIGTTTPEVGEPQNIYGYVGFSMIYNWRTNKMSTTDVVSTYSGEYDGSNPPPANYIPNPQIKTINRLESSKVLNTEQIIYYDIGDISNNVVGGYSWRASFDQDGHVTHINYIGGAGHAFKITWLSPYDEYYVFDCIIGNHYLLAGGLGLDPDNYPSFKQWSYKEYNIYDFVMYNNARYECIKKIDKYELDNYPNSKKPPYNTTTHQINSTYWKIWDYRDHIQILKYPNGLHFVFKGAYYDKIINDPKSSYANLKMIKFVENPKDDNNSSDGFPSEYKSSYNPHSNRAQYVTYTNTQSIISATLQYKVGEEEAVEPETITVADYVHIRSPGNGGSISSSRTQDGLTISADCYIL